jgi:hypothetical protein
MTHDRFNDEETRALAASFRDAGVLVCPRCATPLDRRSVPPRRDVSYVRDRMWVTCANCHRSAVLDRRQPE